ncbi:HPr family phosphocarrier protein [Bilifractor porci]|jgi:phosphocarrier protein HPr|uniref:HPr family phosphocarrier protein n=1 Tax=Bilifractor porci TaxID=2606636 RepID=A0A7X2P9L5_9FIRM|nr:HPr family phosphocarrier protein [Bilifractor porci]MST82326.1 HPr family phosphocarrier protein [Bilifractor porci]
MKSFQYVITDPVGIHARPAGELVNAAQACGADVTIRVGDKSASAKKLIKLMGLGIKQGTEVTVEVSGENEEAAAAEMEKFFKEHL